MAREQRRGCGYRKVGGLYLVGSYISVPCDRLPLPLTACPACGGGIKVSRGFTKINPLRLWGPHDPTLSTGEVIVECCNDKIRPCFLCDPLDEPAYIMLVGAGHYKMPEDFLEEASRMGVSKRIPFIPKDLELGYTIIYLAHPKACEVREPAVVQQAMGILEGAESKQTKLLEAERITKALGIFSAFIPQRVEKLIWESEATPEELEKLEKRGITPIKIPDGDKDHG